MSQTIAIDQEYVEEQTIKAWDGWNFEQRQAWIVSHDLTEFFLDYLSSYDKISDKIKDALFCEYLDNAKREVE